MNLVDYSLFSTFTNIDINVTECGISECTPGYSVGPMKREYYLLHYIISGSGYFSIHDKEYILGEGQLFLLPPGVTTFYKSSDDNPWTYYWVGLKGIKVDPFLDLAGLSVESPVITYGAHNQLFDCFKIMIEASHNPKTSEIRLSGLTYLLFSILIDANKKNAQIINEANSRIKYLKKATRYIEDNLSQKVSVSELSSYIGIDRSYLYSIFKEALNCSPLEFIILHKINKACELLQKTEYSVGKISEMVGYPDPMSFSKLFKKEKSMSPIHYKEYIKKKI